MNRSAILLVFSLFLLVQPVLAETMENLIPSGDAIQTLFDPYPYTELEPDIYDTMIDHTYSFYQSKSYYPVRDGVRITFRITVSEFKPSDHDKRVASMERYIRESKADEGYSKKEPVDLGDAGYVMEITDTYADQVVGCEIGYVTGNHEVWVAYFRKVDPEGFEKNFEDVSPWIGQCLLILKAPEGLSDSGITQKEEETSVSQSLVPGIQTDSGVYKPGDPYTITIRIADTTGKPVPGADISLLLYDPSADTSLEQDLITNAEGTGVLTGTWPQQVSGRIWIRVEAEKTGYESGMAETHVLIGEEEPADDTSSQSGTSPGSTETEPVVNDQVTHIRIGTYLGGSETEPVFIGSIQVLEEDGYVTWHPVDAWEAVYWVPIPDGNSMYTVRLRGPVSADGTFSIRLPSLSGEKMDNLKKALQNNAFTEKIQKVPG